MTFFNARPHFENRQVVQRMGESINLSGQTNFDLGGYNSYIYDSYEDFLNGVSGATFLSLPLSAVTDPISGWSNQTVFSPGIVRIIPPRSVFFSGNTNIISATTQQDVTNYIATSFDSKGTVVWVPFSGITTGLTVWESGSAGLFSIKAKNDSTTNATGDYAHAEGLNTLASAYASHAEGEGTVASADASHSEGLETVASGVGSHAEGELTIASANSSHAEGLQTTASGDHTHAGGAGWNTLNRVTANGTSSFAHFRIASALGNLGAYADHSTILGGTNHNILALANNSAIIGGEGNDITATGLRSVVLGGSGITASKSDTVYVPKLNIQTLGTGTTISSLGIDSNGFVVSGTTGGGVFTGLTISNISTGTSVSILGITSGGTIINGSDLYGEICDYCSNTVSGDVIISSGTTETDDINSDGNTIGSQSPFNCTLWCVYKGGEQVDSTSDFEVASKYQLGGFTLRCCDANSLDGGTNYGTPISGETTTSGDTTPNVVSGITRPISVRQSKKIFLINTHKSDILNSNQVSIVDSTLGRVELSTLSSIITSFNSKIYNSNLSAILSSENGFITNSSNSNIIGSQYSTLSGVTGSTIIGGNNITGTENDTVYVPKLNIDTLGVGTSINNLGIDVNGNVVVGGAGGGIPEATTATTTNINFTGQTIYHNSVTPATGNITNTLTGAKLGLTQKIYHNHTTEPTYPAGWVLMGDAIYFTSTLNVIFAEWAGGTRVEYWYVQEQ